MPTLPDTPMEKMSKGRIRLLVSNAFMSDLVLRLKVVETDMIPTAGVDGTRLYFNPVYVEKLEKEELDFLIAHEICHCVLRHHERHKGKNHFVFNLAADYAVNELLKEMFGHRLPNDCLINEDFYGWSAERIYRHLMRTLPRIPVVSIGNLGRSGQEGVGASVSGDGDKGDGKGDGRIPGNGRIDGQVFGPNTLEGGDAEQDPNAPAPQDWGKLAASAAENCRRQGKHVPDSLARAIRNGPVPDMNWIAALERHFTPAKVDLTWTRPNRRFVHQGIYLPSLGGERMEHAAFVCDSSGSIRIEELGMFRNAFQQVVHATLPMEVTLLYADSDVRAVHTWTEGELPIREWPPVAGGGGTDFRPALKWLAENSTMPSACVFLTDLWGDFGEKPPFPVLWVSVDASHEPAPYGETVYMKVR